MVMAVVGTTGSLERLFLLSRALLRFSTPRFDGINHFAADTSSTSEWTLWFNTVNFLWSLVFQLNSLMTSEFHWIHWTWSFWDPTRNLGIGFLMIWTPLKGWGSVSTQGCGSIRDRYVNSEPSHVPTGGFQFCNVIVFEVIYHVNLVSCYMNFAEKPCILFGLKSFLNEVQSLIQR